MDWQPIETAPKDGTRVILLIPYDRERFSEVECTDGGNWDADDNCWRYDGDDGPFDLQPTHWMTLPAPPMEG